MSASLAVLLAVAGCGSNDQDGEPNAATGGAAGAAELLGPLAPAKGAPVTVGLVTGRGASGDLTIESDVAAATVRYLNEHRSGIAGRPIQLVTCETLADPSKGADCANRMIEKDVPAVVVGATPVIESVWEPLRQAGIPAIFYSAPGNRMTRDPASTFSLIDPMFGVTGQPIQLAKEKKVTKVAAVVVNVPAALNAYQTGGPAFKTAGIDLTVVPVPLGTADMTPQMRKLVDDGPGLVQILGSDAFCISALNGLRAVGYEGPISTIGPCITDATRKAVPGDYLEGIAVSATTPIDTDNPWTRQYKAVLTTYGKDIDAGEPSGMNIFSTMAGFHTALEGLSGDMTPTNIIAAMKTMPEKELPGAGGLKIRCNGKALPDAPAVCGRGVLVTTLDSKGQPTAYRALGVSPIQD